MLSTLFAGTAFACQPNGWDPVDPVFCENHPFPLLPPSSPYVEFDARTAYGVYVLADGTRITADFGGGSITMLFPNGAVQVALISQLDSAAQEQFWKAARHAVDNPTASYELPIDRIQSVIDLASAALSQPGTKSFGEGEEKSNCKPAVDKVLPCIEVTAPSFYYSNFYLDFRPARPGEFFEPGTFFCPYGDSRSMCADYLRVNKENWEKERQSSCKIASASGAVALGAMGLVPSACAATVAAIGATATVVAAPVGAPSAVVAGLTCAAAGVTLIGSGVLALHELGKCQARYAGPGR